MLKVVEATPTIGNTYPLYGMITRIIEDTSDSLVVEINHSIHARLYIKDSDTRETLRRRAFEPAIFVSRVIGEHPHLMVDCEQIIFGKSATTFPQ
jgi:hypothetical protein